MNNEKENTLKIEELEFELIYKTKNLNVNCTIYTMEGQTEMPYKYPIYRVCLNNRKLNPDVFLFYKIDQPGRKFFWYPFAEGKETIGKSIAEALEKIG